MRIYKISKYDMYDMFDLVNEYQGKILSEFFDDKRSMMSWSVVPFARLKKIWQDYMKFGFVRDERGLDQIIETMLNNLAKLQASTSLAGHTQDNPDNIAEEHGYPKIPNEFYDFLNTEYSLPVTDFGLDPLWKLAREIMETNDYESKLVLVDRMLNVVHMNGDLAALFIEGGYDSLQELSGKEN